MAQGFDVTQSLFGDIVTPQQRADASALAQANLGGLGMAQFQAARSQESARQQIPKLFGQQSEEDIVQDVRNKNLPILQSQGKMAYLDAIIADFSARGLGNKAFLAQQLKDQVAQKEAELQATIGLKEAQAQRAVREGRTPLADRLVELQTKANSGQELTTSEAAELKALEKVVKIQAPKGTDLSGLADVMGKEAAKEEGKALGRQLATITGKQQTVESLTDASKILENGIYTGAYSEFQSALAKKTLGVVGDRKRVENTEVFINEVNGNVIPLLKEFGGNDSNEELKFLQRLVGGDITLEENSIRRILASAIKKINRGIKRLEAEKQGITGGKKPQQLEETPSTPVATKRWNPQTNRIESISQ